MTRRRWIVLGLGPWALGLVVLGGACTGASSPPPRFLSIATGGTGGVYYPYGGAIARLISESLPGVQATAEVTGASVDNLKLLQLGKVDIAFTLSDTLAEATSGSGPFKDSGPVASARTLAILYSNYTHVIARQGSGIKRVSDLRGKVVSVGSPGSGTELIADRVLAAAGLDPRKDITRHTLAVAESSGALKDGKVDAFFWSGGLPTPAVQDLAATPGMTVTYVPQEDVLQSMQQKYGRELYKLLSIPAGSYRGQDSEVYVVGVMNLLVGSSALDEQLAYDIVKLLFDKKDALVAAHPEARHLAVPADGAVSRAAFHPGAVRYYKEHGWK
ncbi:MAG TPA: TAXI family TRAP transporter solute-binding subunit [Vicinamibacterales bacterium]|nr:TAXI family TRAP transporter solute-binding subunit [Vicinamibacterales bacterium]